MHAPSPGDLSVSLGACEGKCMHQISSSWRVPTFDKQAEAWFMHACVHACMHARDSREICRLSTEHEEQHEEERAHQPLWVHKPLHVQTPG